MIKAEESKYSREENQPEPRASTFAKSNLQEMSQSRNQNMGDKNIAGGEAFQQHFPQNDPQRQPHEKHQELTKKSDRNKVSTKENETRKGQNKSPSTDHLSTSTIFRSTNQMRSQSSDQNMVNKNMTEEEAVQRHSHDQAQDRETTIGKQITEKENEVRQRQNKSPATFIFQNREIP